MAARPRGGPAGRDAAGRAGRRPHISTFGFVEICKSMEIESLVSTLLRRISLISMKPKGLVWKWQPARHSGIISGSFLDHFRVTFWIIPGTTFWITFGSLRGSLLDHLPDHFRDHFLDHSWITSGITSGSLPGSLWAPPWVLPLTPLGSSFGRVWTRSGRKTAAKQ